jgi:hypothetical protein
MMGIYGQQIVGHDITEKVSCAKHIIGYNGGMMVCMNINMVWVCLKTGSILWHLLMANIIINEWTRDTPFSVKSIGGVVEQPQKPCGF